MVPYNAKPPVTGCVQHDDGRSSQVRDSLQGTVCRLTERYVDGLPFLQAVFSRYPVRFGILIHGRLWSGYHIIQELIECHIVPFKQVNVYLTLVISADDSPFCPLPNMPIKVLRSVF